MEEESNGIIWFGLAFAAVLTDFLFTQSIVTVIQHIGLLILSLVVGGGFFALFRLTILFLKYLWAKGDNTLSWLEEIKRKLDFVGLDIKTLLRETSQFGHRLSEQGTKIEALSKLIHDTGLIKKAEEKHDVDKAKNELVKSW